MAEEAAAAFSCTDDDIDYFNNNEKIYEVGNIISIIVIEIFIPLSFLGQFSGQIITLVMNNLLFVQIFSASLANDYFGCPDLPYWLLRCSSHWQ